MKRRRMCMCKHLGLFTVAVLALSGCTNLAPNVALTRNLVYGVGYVSDGSAGGYAVRELLFDIMEPTDSPLEKRPALILVHGGGFTGGSKESEKLFRLGNDLASAGFVCFLMDYRLMDDNPPAPPPFDLTPLERTAHAATVDVKCAIRHVRANAEYYAVDPERIGLVGESAGAIAGMAAGVSDQGQYASDGPDFPVLPENNPEVNEDVSVLVDLWGNADAFLDDFDPSDPPMMIVHGARDFTAGISLLPAQNIVDRCKTHNIPYRYYPVLDAGHGVWDLEVDGRNLSGLILEFLDEFMAY